MTQSLLNRLQAAVCQDPKYSRLSALPPSGQSLLLYLLCCPHQSGVPGIFRISQPQLLDELKWEESALDRCLQELAEIYEVDVDWSARLVWFPLVAALNRLEDQVAVLECALEFQILPNSHIKSLAYPVLLERLGEMNIDHRHVFERAAGQQVAIGNPVATDQSKPSVSSPRKKRKAVVIARRFDEFWNIYPRKRDKKRAYKAWIDLNLDSIADTIISDIEHRLAIDPQYRNGYAPYPKNYLLGELWGDGWDAGNDCNTPQKPSKIPDFDSGKTVFGESDYACLGLQIDQNKPKQTH